MTSPRDTLFNTPRSVVTPFRFDQPVADVFDDMIRRSVPGYQTVLQMCGLLAQRFADAERIYDLGCSRGAALRAMAQQLSAPTTLIGIDNSQAMIERLQADIPNWQVAPTIHCIEADIVSAPLDAASLITLNWTLQFIDAGQRSAVIEKIYHALRPGGALILSEKLISPDPRQQRLQSELHLAFKRSQGYSELEIAQKRDALEHVLVPESEATHIERLRQAGFDSVELWFRCFNFASFIALK